MIKKRPQSYRKGVGIVLVNQTGQILSARRNDMEEQWQFPQGGIDGDEHPENAMYRELKEELDVEKTHASILGKTNSFLRYTFPRSSGALNRLAKNFAGQELQFYLLRFHGPDSLIDVCGVDHPEFDCWSWVDYWRPVETIVAFKRDTYRRALRELKPYLDGEES